MLEGSGNISSVPSPHRLSCSSLSSHCPQSVNNLTGQCAELILIWYNNNVENTNVLIQIRGHGRTSSSRVTPATFLVHIFVLKRFRALFNPNFSLKFCIVTNYKISSHRKKWRRRTIFYLFLTVFFLPCGLTTCQDCRLKNKT